MQIKSGSYTGTGSSQGITGVGFQPICVITKGRTGTHNGAITISDMGVDVTKDIASSTASFSGGFTSLDSDGFTVGTSALTNANTVVYDYIAFGGGSVDIYHGSYVGNGSGGHAITAPAFQPNLVLSVCLDTTARPQWCTTPNNTVPFGGAGVSTSDFSSFDANGFTLGAGNGTNANAVTYYYLALKNVTGIFKTLSYTGNSTDNRSITGAGFTPDCAWLKSNNLFAGAVFRGKDEVGDVSACFDENTNTDRIQAFESDGIQIGANDRVNNNTDSFWVAVFKNGTSVTTPTLLGTPFGAFGQSLMTQLLAA